MASRRRGRPFVAVDSVRYRLIQMTHFRSPSHGLPEMPSQAVHLRRAARNAGVSAPCATTHARWW
eukprot:8234857-Alexandrium_andersonii.AAC.1